MAQQQRLTIAAAMLLLAANGVAARRLLQPGGIGTLGDGPSAVQTFTFTSAPGKLTQLMASCTWNGFSCKSSYAPAFSSEQQLIDEANYPARAKASIAATNLFCSQFSKDQCAWPCQFDVLNGCQISGHLYYQPWTCPRSLGYAWNHCSQQPQWSSKPACLSSSMCSWNENATTGPAKCTSTYASNMTDTQKLFVYGSLYFTTMPRELHGCCKGSTYAYQLNNFCAAAFSSNGTGSTSAASCAKVPGCTWDVYNSDGCVPSPQTQVQLQFAYKPSDPLAAPLKKLAGECAAITDADKCSSYKPMAVDPSKVQTYLDKALLSSLNQPQADSACPLPSRPPPWV